MNRNKKTDDEKKAPIMVRFVQACLLLCGIVALYLALQVAAQIWAWLLFLAIVSLVFGGLIWYFRWLRNRRW